MVNEARPSRPTAQPLSPEQIEVISSEQTRRLDEADAMLLEAKSWPNEQLSGAESIVRAFVMRQRYDRLCDSGIALDLIDKPEDSRQVLFEVGVDGTIFGPQLGVRINTIGESLLTEIYVNPYQRPHAVNVVSFRGDLDEHDTRTAARIAEAYFNAIVLPIEEVLGLPKLPDADRHLKPETELDLYLGG